MWYFFRVAAILTHKHILLETQVTLQQVEVRVTLQQLEVRVTLQRLVVQVTRQPLVVQVTRQPLVVQVTPQPLVDIMPHQQEELVSLAVYLSCIVKIFYY